MDFKDYMAAFKQSEHWAHMEKTVENSPWHREANVAVHTQMVLDQYEQHFAPSRSATANKVSLFALLYHDFGKPAAEETVLKKDGSGDTYRRYAGHEPISAHGFMEAYVTNKTLRGMLTKEEARAVRWLIEHHLPYGFTDKQKRRGLNLGSGFAMNDAGLEMQTFYDCLRSDAAGRISDDHETKLANVEKWIKEFDELYFAVMPEVEPNAPKMFLLVGPSGSGKSTYLDKHVRAGDIVLSMDRWRDEFVGGPIVGESLPDRYSRAWDKAVTEHREFDEYMRVQIKEAITKMKDKTIDVYIDNTNLNRKRRQRWVEIGRKQKMHIVGVEFWTTFKTLYERQKTRGDKSVPYMSLKQQFSANSLCWKGQEVDEVVTVFGE